MDENAQRLLFRELATFVEPLGGLAQDPDALVEFLYRIGWPIEDLLGNDTARVVEAFAGIAGAVDTLTDLADDPPQTVPELQAGLAAARALFGLVDALPALLGTAAPPNADRLPGDVIEALTLVYLARRTPRLHRLLELLTVIRERGPAEGATVRDALRTIKYAGEIQLDRLGRLLTRPGEVFAEEYWPDGVPNRVRAAEVADRLFPRIQQVIEPHEVNQAPVTRRLGMLHGRGIGPEDLPAADEQRLAAMLTFVWDLLDGTTSDFREIGLSVGILPADEGGPGVFVVPTGASDFLHRFGDWVVQLSGSAELPGFRITDDGLAFFTAGAGIPNVELVLVPVPEGSRRLLIGAADGTRLEVGEFFVSIGLRQVNDDTELRVMVSLTDAAFVVGPDSADSFLRNFLPSGDSRIEFSTTVGWSSLNGFEVEGSGALETRIPAHVRLGPVTGTGIVLGLTAGDEGLDAKIGADLTVEVGPVSVVVQDIGLRLSVGFPRSGGNAGPLELAPAFKPPSGAGLAIDAGVLTGGGFLSFDPERGEYAGVVELELADFISLKGIGLISTRLPDGSDGFSLLIVLSAEFPEPGLQLGFGFKLLAVGGLVGVNRTVRMQALMDGVRSGAIESIMFPEDVVANAPRVLRDLQAFFPAQRDRFLIGPMVKLAWGSPALIVATVAVVVEIPGNVAFAGVLKLALPRDDTPILLLQVNFAGLIETDQRRMFFFAGLFESRVLHLTLDGDMGVLISWGEDANLVVTVGGFHPSYTPPPLPFPAPRRMHLDILSERNARLGLSGYFAVTSNTVQFGAAVDLYFKFSAFRVEGHAGFDALFQLSPFAFTAEASASVSLKAFGVGCFSISLRFTLEGPTPWRAHGRGSVSLLFFDISANFDITWGEHRDTQLPPVRVLPIVAAEFAKPANWQTLAPRSKPLVSLRQLPGSEEDLVLHPLGTLFVRQQAVPLDLTLDRIGAQQPSDVDRVTVEVTGGPLVKLADATESFALAQFQDMDDAAKLSLPAFQREHAGLELAPAGGALTSVHAVRRTARYEEIVIDSARPRVRRRFAVFQTRLFEHFLRGDSISRSELSQAQRSLRQPFTDAIRVTGDTFAVARTQDNTLAAPAFANETAARQYLARQLALDPELTGTLHVIPAAEAMQS
ncbi:hypothetical protein E0H75_22270 [Kribbella capetownensis]|uniref:DUF6603 domain-containing protein n=1 Tax=Kribbella capetownensis TaxID=1572659 RepID=A0A4R0JR27_9ACTN|nr:DUF6603 domain-containing protein [Kribbella capetownensis]TCC47506.1 hypothetical protein E0H75_22270 [Kribbella capetownensis]